MWRDLLKFKHLLLVDLHSSGACFYLAKQVSELPSLDFGSLVLLEQIFDDQLCRDNHLAQAERWQALLQRKLAVWQLRSYTLVFLVPHDVTAMEKRFLAANLPFWQPVHYVHRDFFYHFYITQKRNFSAVKLLISCFADCVELSLFHQDQLLAHATTTWFAMTAQVEHFLNKRLQALNLKRPDCVYLFTHNQATATKAEQLTQLASTLQLEVNEIKQLCSHT